MERLAMVVLLLLGFSVVLSVIPHAESPGGWPGFRQNLRAKFLGR